MPDKTEEMKTGWRRSRLPAELHMKQQWSSAKDWEATTCTNSAKILY